MEISKDQTSFEIKRLVLEHNKTEKAGAVARARPDDCHDRRQHGLHTPRWSQSNTTCLFERLKNRIEYANSITCTLLLFLALFVGISPISDKAKIRFMYVGAALSLMAVPMMSYYIAGLNDIVDELRYQAVLVFIVVVCCYCFVMANMVKYNVMKKKGGGA